MPQIRLGGSVYNILRCLFDFGHLMDIYTQAILVLNYKRRFSLTWKYSFVRIFAYIFVSNLYICLFSVCNFEISFTLCMYSIVSDVIKSENLFLYEAYNF